MLAIPVVEVKSGQCVHAHSTDTKSKVTKDNPIKVIGDLTEQGASVIQVVDIDAVSSRQPEHISLIEQIKTHFPSVKLQVTGGISCSEDILIWLDAGADWITLGGRVVRKLDLLEMILVEFGKHVIVGFDVRASLWSQGYCPVANMSLTEWLTLLEEEGVAALMFTEIPERGHVNGHNLNSARELASRVQLPIIAHGGVNSRDDLINLTSSEYKVLHGVTLSKPLYGGAFSYAEAASALH